MSWWTLSSHSNLLYYSRVGGACAPISAHPVSEHENNTDNPVCDMGCYHVFMYNLLFADIGIHHTSLQKRNVSEGMKYNYKSVLCLEIVRPSFLVSHTCTCMTDRSKVAHRIM